MIWHIFNSSTSRFLLANPRGATEESTEGCSLDGLEQQDEVG